MPVVLYLPNHLNLQHRVSYIQRRQQRHQRDRMDSTEAPQIIEHIHKSVPWTPYDVKWVPFSARFVAMVIQPNAKGALNVYQLNNGDLETILEGKTASGVKCGTFAASATEDRYLATGDHAGKLVVYDLENISQPIFSQQAHTSIINAIDGCGGMDVGFGAPEIVTGGRDGCVRLWDQRVNEPVLALEPSEGQPARDCWTVGFGNSFGDEDRCIVAGYDNGDVKVGVKPEIYVSCPHAHRVTLTLADCDLFFFALFSLYHSCSICGRAQCGMRPT